MWKEQKVMVTTHHNSDLVFPGSYLQNLRFQRGSQEIYLFLRKKVIEV